MSATAEDKKAADDIKAGIAPTSAARHALRSAVSGDEYQRRHELEKRLRQLALHSCQVPYALYGSPLLDETTLRDDPRVTRLKLDLDQEEEPDDRPYATLVTLATLVEAETNEEVRKALLKHMDDSPSYGAMLIWATRTKETAEAHFKQEREDEFMRQVDKELRAYGDAKKLWSTTVKDKEEGKWVWVEPGTPLVKLTRLAHGHEEDLTTHVEPCDPDPAHGNGTWVKLDWDDAHGAHEQAVRWYISITEKDKEAAEKKEKADATPHRADEDTKREKKEEDTKKKKDEKPLDPTVEIARMLIPWIHPRVDRIVSERMLGKHVQKRFIRQCHARGFYPVELDDLKPDHLLMTLDDSDGLPVLLLTMTWPTDAVKRLVMYNKEEPLPADEAACAWLHLLHAPLRASMLLLFRAYGQHLIDELGPQALAEDPRINMAFPRTIQGTEGGKKLAADDMRRFSANTVLETKILPPGEDKAKNTTSIAMRFTPLYMFKEEQANRVLYDFILKDGNNTAWDVALQADAAMTKRSRILAREDKGSEKEETMTSEPPPLFPSQAKDAAVALKALQDLVTDATKPEIPDKYVLLEETHPLVDLYGMKPGNEEEGLASSSPPPPPPSSDDIEHEEKTQDEP
jgi:hypothetical protein